MQYYCDNYKLEDCQIYNRTFKLEGQVISLRSPSVLACVDLARPDL